MLRIIFLLLLLPICAFSAPARAQTTGAPASSTETDYPSTKAGVFIQDSSWTQLNSAMPSRTRAARGFAASLSYGLVPAKVVAEYPGEHAAAQVTSRQPVICICNIISLPGQPAIVRLQPRKGRRELDGGKMIVYPVVGGSKTADAKKSDLIPVDVSQSTQQVWLVRPQIPLEPGEYALMLGTQNLNIFPFAVAPSAASGAGN